MKIECINCKQNFDAQQGFICPNCAYLNPLIDIDYFSYLELPKDINVNLAKLEEQYTALMLKYHPDKFVSKTEEQKVNSLNHSGYLNQAYDALKNETSRFAYMYKIINNESIIEENTVNNSELFMEFFKYYEELENIEHTDDLKIFVGKLSSLKQDILRDNQDLDFTNKEVAYKIYIKLKYIDKILEKSITK